jgi:hypothetical protein
MDNRNTGAEVHNALNSLYGAKQRGDMTQRKFNASQSS